MDENKRCPFCGLLNWRMVSDTSTDANAIECRSCGARGPVTVPGKEVALAAWNNRAGWDDTKPTKDHP